MKHVVPERLIPLTSEERPSEPLPSPSDWTIELINEYHAVIKKTARRFGLDTYPTQLEIITAEQMMDAYSTIGMPINYRHWSFGKEFVVNEARYRRGEMGLAYEIVINSSPCIAYLMEENTMAMQALVIAHAAYGHNSFFKGNYLFRMWTDAEGIIDYLVYSKKYIAECEERYGLARVEGVLDACHALQNYGVDRYRHASKRTLAAEAAYQKERAAHAQRMVNDLWRTLPKSKNKPDKGSTRKRFPPEPEENILYFIEKKAPNLKDWEREIVRIVRKQAQYFYPQRQTQLMNEGWATFWHYTILNQMYDDGYLTDGLMFEFMKSHTNVIYQPPVGHPAYSGINPYALGFAMFRDLRRICEGGVPDPERPGEIIKSDSEQLAEDREWFPNIAGKDWIPVLHEAMQNHKDESFIGQYLSPRLMREFRLFAIEDDVKQADLVVAAIHNEAGYKRLREKLANQYDLSKREPNIQVYDVDVRGDRSLTLLHEATDGRPLNPNTTKEVLLHVARLWGFGVGLDMVDGNEMDSMHVKAPDDDDEDDD